jgi:hypothetical protein
MHMLGHADHEQENTEVHKRQVSRNTNIALSKASPSASHQLSLAFLLITTLCYICLCIKFVGVEHLPSYP